jgi:hypothetical protein
MWYTRREQKCVQYLMGNPERKRPLGRLRGRWEDKLKYTLRK